MRNLHYILTGQNDPDVQEDWGLILVAEMELLIKGISATTALRPKIQKGNLNLELFILLLL
jgi:hypothetical protein